MTNPMGRIGTSLARNLGAVPGVVWVIGIALLAALPLWQPGFLNTKAAGETPYLLARVQQISAALKDGVFPVRWMHDGAYGLGYPFFNFYGALPYYLASILNLLGFGIVFGLKATHTLGFIIGALGMYAWIRTHLRTRSAALVAVAVFTFAPMHMLNVYVRGDSLSEFWAMGLFPVVLWAIDRVIYHPHPGSAALLGICGAMVIVSHNISALIFLPLAALYGLWMLLSRFRVKRFAALVAGGLLALLLSAWFWLPALAERDTVQTDGRMTEGYFYWGNNFLDDQIVGSGFFYDYAGFPPRIGLWQAIMIGCGLAGVIVMSVYRRPPRRIVVWAVLVFGFSVLMTQSLASFVYESFTVFSYLQFTWRWLTVAALSGAVLAAYTVEVWDSAILRQNLGGVFVAATILAGAANLELEFIPVADSDITVARLAEREYYSGDIGTTVTTEYLPAGMNPRIFSGPLVVDDWNLKVLDGNASGRLVERRSAHRTWDIEVLSKRALVSVPVMYWPGWSAQLEDGSPLDTSAVDGIGWVQMQVPQGNHSVELELRNTPIRWTANTLSLLGALVVVVALRRLPWQITGYIRHKIRVTHIGVVVVVTSAVLIGHVLLPNDASEGPYATQFWRNSFRHAYEEGLTFSDGARLVGYDYPRDVRPGQTLTISLKWEDTTDASVELIPPLVNLWNVDVALALGTGTDTVSLPISPDAAAGLYFVRLVHNREVYDLTPVRIHIGEPGPSNADPLGDFGDVLRLLDVRTEGLNRGRLNVYLQWQVLREITENYSFALRLYNPTGQQLGAHDGLMGGYGGYPPAYWQGHFSDWATLSGLDGLPPGDGYRLAVTVYTPDGALGRLEIDGLEIRESPVQPMHAVSEFSGNIELEDTQVEQGNSLPILCQWQGPVHDGWQVEWVFGDDYRLLTSLAPGARLDWWRPHQYYRAHVLLSVPLDMEPKLYSLRWRIVDQDGTAVTSLQSTGTIEVVKTQRAFVPSGAQPVASFGPIELLNHRVEQIDDTLVLDVSWGISERLQDNYTLFVHVMNPVDNFVVAQSDTVPRSGTYPVTRWLPGEMVEDTIQVDLQDVGPGDYVIGLGWYNPQDPLARLPAFTANGDPLPDNRFVLPEHVTRP